MPAEADPLVAAPTEPPFTADAMAAPTLAGHQQSHPPDTPHHQQQQQQQQQQQHLRISGHQSAWEAGKHAPTAGGFRHPVCGGASSGLGAAGGARMELQNASAPGFLCVQLVLHSLHSIAWLSGKHE
eukprot:1162067-Pelagomonas_calceolata.AAC.6